VKAPYRCPHPDREPARWIIRNPVCQPWFLP
jgi:hypothetical protein